MPGVGEAAAPALSPAPQAGPTLLTGDRPPEGHPQCAGLPSMNPWLPLHPVGTASDWPQPPCQPSITTRTSALIPHLCSTSRPLRGRDLELSHTGSLNTSSTPTDQHSPGDTAGNRKGEAGLEG